MSVKTFLGIDQGIANCGFAVIGKEGDVLSRIDSGTIVTKPEMVRHHRIALICERIESLIQSHSPVGMATELLMYTPVKNRKDNRSSQIMNVNMVTGGLALLAARHEMTFDMFVPGTIRKSVAGHGHADEDTLREALGPLAEGVETKHELDAIALGVHLATTPLPKEEIQ